MSRRMKDSGIAWIGEIPEDWEAENIGSQVKEIRNPNLEGKESNALQFKMGAIIAKSQGNSNYNPDSLDLYNIVEDGVIMLNGLNLSFDFLTQRVGLVKERGVITSTYIAIKPHKTLDSSFLTYLFKSYDNCKAFHGMGKGLRQTLSYNELKRYLLIRPSLCEQQAIANFLDIKYAEVNEMIALQEKIIDELKLYKQSVITEAVTKGLNPNVPLKDSGIEWIGKIPEHWDVMRVKNICSSNNSTLSDSTDENFEFSYVDIGSVNYEKGIVSSEVFLFKNAPSRARRIAKLNDIIVSTVRTYLRAIDIIDKEEKVNFIYSTGFAILSPLKNVFSRFIINICRSEYFTHQVSLFSNGINYPSINSTNLSCISVFIPPMKEQQQITDYLDQKCAEIDKLSNIKQQKINELKEYKKSIIYEYVTGKKQVKI